MQHTIKPKFIIANAKLSHWRPGVHTLKERLTLVLPTCTRSKDYPIIIEIIVSVSMKKITLQISLLNFI